MPTTKQQAVRLETRTIEQIDRLIERLQAPVPRYRLTRSDIIRLAVDDYLRRNG